MQLKPLTLGSVSGCCSAYRRQGSRTPLENVNLHNWVKMAPQERRATFVLCAHVWVCVFVYVLVGEPRVLWITFPDALGWHYILYSEGKNLPDENNVWVSSTYSQGMAVSEEEMKLNTLKWERTLNEPVSTFFVLTYRKVGRSCLYGWWSQMFYLRLLSG